jgi:periplasmic protein TonB
MYSEQNRVFNYAVLASIVLHGMLLFGISQREPTRPAGPPIPLVARLVELPAPSPAPAAATPLPQVEPVKPKPRMKPAAPKPVAKEKPAPPPEPAAEPAAEEPRVAQMESAAPAPGPVAPPPVAGIARAPAPAAPSAAEPAEDPGSLEKYRLQLYAVAPKYKHYPRIATDNNWKGLVALRMVMAPSGRIAWMTVTKTSGYDVLDQQALEMFRKAAEVVPVPPILRGKQFAVDVAADYYLTD